MKFLNREQRERRERGNQGQISFRGENYNGHSVLLCRDGEKRLHENTALDGRGSYGFSDGGKGACRKKRGELLKRLAREIDNLMLNFYIRVCSFVRSRMSLNLGGRSAKTKMPISITKVKTGRSKTKRTMGTIHTHRSDDQSKVA